MIKSNGKIYIESQNIRVFPCAYRGYYNNDNPLVFDPEARATTEANFTNTFHKLSNNKESYIIAWIPNSVDEGSTGTLKCVIGGYYFEIYNQTIDDFFDPESGAPYYLCIRTTNVDLGTAEIDASNARTTPILQSFYDDAEHYLDIKIGALGYAFTGLAVNETKENCTACLAPFAVIDEYVPDMIAGENNKDAQIGKYYADPTTKRIILIETKDDALTNGTQLYRKESMKALDPSQLPVTNILDAGHGKYSIRMLEDTTLQGINTTTATGDYSIALGKSTVAEGETSTALGDNTSAKGDGSFTVGILTEAIGNAAVALNNQTKAFGDASTALGSNTTAEGQNSITGGNATSASGANAVALGDHTKTETANQVVIGAYNVKDDNQAFIIANGDATAGSNKFTVSKTGDVKALGTLETKGSIKATGKATNDLELGTSAKGSSGSIKVYGTATTPVFSVANSGNTDIAGTTTIAGATTITNDTEYTAGNNFDTTAAALKVKGGVGIAKNLNVGGTTTLNNALTVAEDKTTTLGGSLTVADATTLNSTLKVTGITTLENDTEITNTTESTSTTTGALKVSGGAGIAKNLNVGGTANITGKAQITDTTAASGNDAALTVKGGEIIGENLIIKGTTSSDSKTAGALVVGGGAGIGENLYIGGTATVTGATTLNNNLTVAAGKTTTLGGDTKITSKTAYTKSGNTVTAALSVDGGTHITGTLRVDTGMDVADNFIISNTLVRIKATTDSSTANSGALVVDGGVGIAKNVNIAKTLKTKDLNVASTDGETNILTIGSESSANKGGKLIIYGTGTTKVFSVDQTGKTIITGKLEAKDEVTIAKKLTVENSIEISKTNGITGLTKLNVQGQIDATVFNAASDARLKCNIKDYKFKGNILDLPIKEFEYINDKSHTTYIGCLAQDLQKVCPELVNQNTEGFLSIQESKLVYALIQEVKILKEQLEQLKRR